MTTRGRKSKPGRITFVGSGPGDPGLLTTRARAVLANAALVFTDPDVPEAVLAIVGSELPPTSGPAEAAPQTDDAATAEAPAAAATIPGGADVRPALGDPTEVAKLLVHEARTGVDVVRLVAGDPLSVDAVITEVSALARTQAQFEIVPGLAPATAVPTYAGLPLGSSHTVADVRGDVDWAALAAAPGPLILHATATHLADAARTLIEYGLTESTPCVVTANGTTCQQRSVETTLAGLLDKSTLAGADPAGPLAGPLVVTIGKTVANRSKLNWWENRALYGWTVLVPRTKDQAGEMSDRLVVPRCAADRGADHRGRAAAQPRADGKGRQGFGGRPLPVGGVHLDQRRARGVGEVQRVRSRRACVLRREDRLRRAGHGRPGPRLRNQPRTGAVG